MYLVGDVAVARIAPEGEIGKAIEMFINKSLIANSHINTYVINIIFNVEETFSREDGRTQ
jgi:hypothetical protein